VLAVYEDVHWADPSTLELLGMLVEQAPTVLMLHVLAFRPDFVPPWSPCSHITPLTLAWRSSWLRGRSWRGHSVWSCWRRLRGTLARSQKGCAC